MKQIIYLGIQDDYIQHLKVEAEAFSGITIKCLDPSSLHEAYSFAIQQQPQIIVMDLPFFNRFQRNFADQIRKVMTHKVHFIVVYPDKEEAVEQGRLTTLGDIIFCIRNFNVDDVVNFFKNVLYRKTELEKEASPKVYFKDTLNLFQSMRVRYLARTYARIESNRYFENNSLITLNFPYFKNLFHSTQHKILNRSSSDIHSHYIYSYQMEYQYLKDALSLETKTKLLADCEYELNGKQISEELYGPIEEILKERKSLVLTDAKKVDEQPADMSHEEHTTLKKLEMVSKTLYFNWLLTNSDQNFFHKENITIYDTKGTLLQEGTDELFTQFVSVIHRPLIKNPREEILIDKPSVIVINFDQENNVEKIKELIASSTQMRDYFPFVLVFNYKHSPDVLRDKLEYHFVLATSMQPNEQFLIKFLGLFRKKKMEKEWVKGSKRFSKLQEENAKFVLLDETILYDYRVYKRLEDLESLFLYKVEAQIIWMSEFEIMIKTSTPLEVGEVFRINKPFDIQLAVVEKSSDDSYRTTIHLVNDADKYSLRTFIDDIMDLTQMNKIPLPPQELPNLKAKHFSKNSSSVF